MTHESQAPVRHFLSKRVALEWAYVTLMTASLVLAAGWVYTRSDKTHLLAFRHFASFGPHDVGLLVGCGQLAVYLYCQYEGRQLRVDPRTPGVLIRTNGGVQIPGLRIRYEQFARNGAPAVWDVRISLLIPAALSVLVASLCRGSLAMLLSKRKATQPTGSAESPLRTA